MEFCTRICLFVIFAVPFVASFSWKDCGDSTQLIKINSLDAFNNNTKILYITGRGKVAENITSPIQGRIDMQKKFFWGWTKIPCVENVGSCIYDDICSLSPYENIDCPEVYSENNLPCSCPILAKQYSAKKFPIDMSSLPKWIEAGKYRLKINLHADEKQLMCLLLYLQL